MTKAEFLFVKLKIEKPWHIDLDDFDAKTFLIRFRELNKNDDIWIDIDNDLKWKSVLFIGSSVTKEFYSLDFKNCIIEALLYYYNYEQEFSEWQNRCLEKFIEKITNQTDPDPRIDKMVDTHFWELMETNEK